MKREVLDPSKSDTPVTGPQQDSMVQQEGCDPQVALEAKASEAESRVQGEISEQVSEKYGSGAVAAADGDNDDSIESLERQMQLLRQQLQDLPPDNREDEYRLEEPQGSGEDEETLEEPPAAVSPIEVAQDADRQAVGESLQCESMNESSGHRKKHRHKKDKSSAEHKKHKKHRSSHRKHSRHKTNDDVLVSKEAEPNQVGEKSGEEQGQHSRVREISHASEREYPSISTANPQVHMPDGFKRRHMNKLFIRGDNVVMVSLLE